MYTCAQRKRKNEEEKKTKPLFLTLTHSFFRSAVLLLRFVIELWNVSCSFIAHFRIKYYCACNENHQTKRGILHIRNEKRRKKTDARSFRNVLSTFFVEFYFRSFPFYSYSGLMYDIFKMKVRAILEFVKTRKKKKK